MAEDYVDQNLYDNNKNYLNEVNQTGLDNEEVEETTETENEGVIRRYITENQT